jgi:hypothetical protein
MEDVFFRENESCLLFITVSIVCESPPITISWPVPEQNISQKSKKKQGHCYLKLKKNKKMFCKKTNIKENTPLFTDFIP